MRKYHIRPSHNFTETTIAKVTAASHRRKFFTDLLTPVAIFSPLLLREVWLALFYHQDYFTVGRWPLANLLLRTYDIFVSNLLTYLLLGLGAALVALYFLSQRVSYRRHLLFRSFYQLFNLDRFRI